MNERLSAAGRASEAGNAEQANERTVKANGGAIANGSMLYASFL